MVRIAITEDEAPFRQVVLFPIGELLLTILPLVVLSMVELTMGKGWLHVVESAEWSFGAAVLFGQTIFKVVAGVVRVRVTEGWEAIGLLVVVLIVFGLVPSLVVLALRLTTAEPPTSLVVFQAVLFLVSAGTFLVLGTVAHYALFHAVREELSEVKGNPPRG
jgi:hypothetical protein